MNEAGVNGIYHGCVIRDLQGNRNAQSNGRFSLRERSLRFSILVLISFLSVDFGILFLSFLII